MTSALPAPRPVTGLSLIGSVLLHLGLLGAASALALRGFGRAPPPGPEGAAAEPPRPALELPAFYLGEVEAPALADPEGALPEPRAGSPTPHPDLGRGGQGGDGAGPRALNLASSDDGFTRTGELQNRLDRAQIQRLATARERRTRDDRRASLEPMELSFLASGAGDVPARRTPSPERPSRGALRAPSAATRGGFVGAASEDPDALGARPGARAVGAARDAPGVGLLASAPGEVHHAAAPVVRARPLVAEARPTVPAAVAGRTSDTVDADQEVATAVASLVTASHQGGRGREGRGGDVAPGAPAAGGGAGASRSTPLGEGVGDVFDLGSDDPRVVAYFRGIHAKIHPLWRDAFPKSAMAELKQGVVILEFELDAQGRARVLWPPVRPSGVEAFDRACADAVRKASPFGPLPPALGRTALRVRAPFDARNPIVR